MAIYRETPKCPQCGEVIAEAVHDLQKDEPLARRKIGDTFRYWDYKKHKCKKKKPANKEGG